MLQPQVEHMQATKQLKKLLAKCLRVYDGIIFNWKSNERCPSVDISQQKVLLHIFTTFILCDSGIYAIIVLEIYKMFNFKDVCSYFKFEFCCSYSLYNKHPKPDKAQDVFIAVERVNQNRLRWTYDYCGVRTRSLFYYILILPHSCQQIKKGKLPPHCGSNPRTPVCEANAFVLIISLSYNPIFIPSSERVYQFCQYVCNTQK